MKRLLTHDLFSSFTLWFEHTLLKQGEAYTNTGSRFFPVEDDPYAGYQVFAAPFKQLVYDSSITGALIPSGVYVDGSFTPRGVSGLKIDYNNSRGIFDSGSANWMVSGDYAVKDFNIYTTAKPDEELVFDTRFQLYPQFPQNLTGVSLDDVVAPCIFLKFVNLGTEPFAFGGPKESTYRMRAIILAADDYTLDAVGDIFVGKKLTNFSIFPRTPLTQFGDVKSGVYSYDDYCSQFFSYKQFPYFSDIDYSKLLQKGSKDIGAQVGFLDFELKLVI